MRTKLKTKDLVISALLIAIGILIPMIFTGPPFRIVVGPYSATLMAHVPVIIAMFISPWTAVFTAVGTTIGFFFTVTPLGSILALLVFFIVLKISKYVSLSSVLASVSVLFAVPFLDISLVGKIVVAAVILILIYRHRSNLKRVINGTESKIKWM